MKKLLFVILALLFTMGVANAASIPLVSDPKNQPEIWTMEVYNNQGSALTSGYVVSWDNEGDTTDSNYAYRTMWVTLPAIRDDVQVAGIVVDDTIPTGSIGTIAIFGPVYALVLDSTAAVTAADLVSAYDTTGKVGDFGGAGADEAVLGYCISASPVAIAYGGYAGADGQDNIMLPIFVDISRFSDD